MERKGVELHVDELPPSVNKMYTVVRGRKILSSEGRGYKNRLKIVLAKQLIDYSPLGRNTPLKFSYKLVFQTILNKGYPDKAANLFKRVDISNRIKILEDIICDLLDVDDSQVIYMEVMKCKGVPHVCVKVEPADPIAYQSC